MRSISRKIRRWIAPAFEAEGARLRVAVVLGLIVGLVLTAAFGRRGYRVWKEQRLVRQAQAFLGKHQYSQALLCVHVALSINNQDPAATRIMAELAEHAGYPISVFWRKRVVDLEPGPVQNRFDWVSTTLKFADPNLAAEALETVPEPDRKSLEYQRLAARVAFAANEIDAATAHLAEAVKLNPKDDLLRFNLAVLRLRERDLAALREARAVLESFQTNALLADEALRVLTRDALRQRDLARAGTFVKALLAQPKAVFPDRLLRLSVLSELNDPGLPQALKAAQEEARKDPILLYGMCTWMIEHKMPDQALAWLKTLPPDLETRRLLPMLRADCYLAKGNWTQIEQALREENWDQQEFLRYATIAYSLRQQGAEDAAHSNWDKALNASNDKPETLAALAQLTSVWGWQNEREEVLWAVTRKHPEQRWALKALHLSYLASGNTRGMLNLYNLLAELVPHDLRIKNNKAAVCFLLKTDLDEAHKLALEVYTKDPRLPTFVATYAFSLHLQGKTAEGLKLMQQLTEDKLLVPGTAAYYAMLLSASGQKEQAAKYAAAAQHGRLLPEERELLAKR